MAKLPYEAASSDVETVEDVILYSSDIDNAFFDPWGNVKKLELN